MFANAHCSHKSLLNKNSQKQIDFCQEITGNDWEIQNKSSKYEILIRKGLVVIENDWDLGEIYSIMKKNSIAKKESNKEFSTNLLIKLGIDFETKNNGIHLIITTDILELIDFYPSTGKWIPRGKKSYRGIKNLIKYITN